MEDPIGDIFLEFSLAGALLAAFLIGPPSGLAIWEDQNLKERYRVV